MKSVAIAVVTFLLCCAIAAFWFSRTYVLLPVAVGDDYMILGPAQTRECMDGGGCAIFSQREFYAEASKLIQHLQKQKGRALSPGEWDI